jgi:hypothetical protein
MQMKLPGMSLAQVFRKPWQRHHVRLVRIRSINFEGDSLFGKDIEQDDPRRREMRIEAYGLFDRHKKFNDHSIEIYIRTNTKYNSSWSENSFGRSMVSFSMPENVFTILYKSIIKASETNEFVIVLSVGTSKLIEGFPDQIEYPCRFECLQILPNPQKHSHGSEAMTTPASTLVTTVARVEKAMMWVLFGLAAIGALLLWRR